MNRSKMGLGDRVKPNCHLRGGVVDQLTWRGRWQFWHRSVTGLLIDQWSVNNIIVNQGLSHALQVVANTGQDTAVTNWFIGIATGMIGNVDAADTLASKLWTELSTEYDEATRQTWQKGNEANRIVSNAANLATFTASQPSVTVDGAFMTESAIKGSTSATDVLLNASAFQTLRTLQTGETIDIMVELSAATAP